MSACPSTCDLLPRPRTVAPLRRGRPRTPLAAQLAALLALLALAACGNDSVEPGPDADAQQGDIGSDVQAQDTATAADTATASDTSPADVPGDILGRNPPCKGPADCGDAPGPCLRFVCDSNLGCVPATMPDDSICQDGDACTALATCKSGSCVVSATKDCDDTNPCTDDLCKDGTCVSIPTTVTPTACDDNNACTTGDACQDGSCKGPINTCLCQTDADCKDKGKDNLCAGSWYCAVQSGGGKACVQNPATIVNCNASSDSPCQKNLCDPATGTCSLKTTADGGPCDDGNPCSAGETCSKGACGGGTQICCTADVDCAKAEDGDACNGVLFCNKATGKCQLNPQTIVKCPTVDDTTCSTNTCDPKTGTCAPKSTSDGEVCDDGNPCTPGETCKGGVCLATETNTCPCKVDSDCADKDDGDPCNGVSYCDVKAGTCAVNPATIVVCATVDDTTCSKNTCDPKTGGCKMAAVFDGTPCNADGNPCTPNDACKAGSCVVDDINTCVCSTNADCAAQDDGDLCNGQLFCEKSTAEGEQGKGTCKVNPATIPSCPSVDNTECIKSICQGKTGKCAMTFVNQGEVCDDGDVCTKGDTCNNGKCKPGGDICLCHGDADCLPQEDGDVCNGTLYCAKDAIPWNCKVKPSTVITCSTVNDGYCQQSICQAKTGLCKLTPLHTDEPCDDDDTCTVNTVCKAGICVDPLADSGGKCNDGNPCTDDSCDKQLGCLYKANTADCDDGDKCTLGDICANKVCTKGKPNLCDDNNPCTTDLCNPQSGCVGITNSNLCSDDDGCTVGDACKGGQCIPGKPADCADNNPCSIDSCDSKTGECKHDDKVSAAQVCDDGIDCTVDTCSPITGCAHLGADVACDDKIACTSDVCSTQVGCQHFPTPESCDDKDTCTVDVCTPGVGCSHTAAVDGAACFDSDPCTVGDTCKAGKCTAGPKSAACSVDPTQCKGKPNGTACNDGDACSTGETCSGGVCSVVPSAYEIETIAGNGGYAVADGFWRTAQARHPVGVALAPSGAIGFVDDQNGAVREVGLDGQVRTIVGSHNFYNGDKLVDGKAPTFGWLNGLVYANDGTIYVADAGFDAIRKVGTDGTVTTLAGGTAKGYADGKGAQAKFLDPAGIAIFDDGALLIADGHNNVLRRLAQDGTATTFAGKNGYGGTIDGKGDAARMQHPYGLIRAPDGSFLFTDRHRHNIRRVLADGTVSTVAGSVNGLAGTVDGKGDVVRLSDPCGVAAAPDGRIYISECNVHRIRRIDPDGTVTTIIGTAGAGYVEGIGNAAKVYTPARLVFDAFGDLVVADWDNHVLRRIRFRTDLVGGKVCEDGKVCTRDGCDKQSGTCKFAANTCDDGNSCTKDVCNTVTGGCEASAEPNSAPCTDGDPCTALNVCQGGSCYAAAPTAKLWGNGIGATDGKLKDVRLYWPAGLRRGPDGRMALTESSTGRLRVLRTDGVLVTVAGGFSGVGFADGTATAARFNQPLGVDFTADGGFVVADMANHRIRAVSPTGMVSTVAGTGTNSFIDGPVAIATFNQPNDVVVDSKGALLVADRQNHRVRKVSAGVVSTLTGQSTWGLRDGPLDVALFEQPQGLAVGGDGAVYVADSSNHAIRRITPDGLVVTVVGNDRPLDVEGVGLAASVRYPRSLTVAKDGSILVAGWEGYISRIDTTGRLQFIAGGGSAQSGPAQALDLANPGGIAEADNGEIWVVAASKHQLLTLQNPALSCDDGNACTVDSCVPKVGCKHVNDVSPCDDGDACTASGTCAAGVCKAGAKVTGCICKNVAGLGCDDSNSCTVDTCDPQKGCAHAAVGGGEPCDDGSACTTGERCTGSNCLADPDQVIVRHAGGSEVAANGTVHLRDGSAKLAGGVSIAGLNYPTGLATDGKGKIWIADSLNHSVRVLLPNGQIDTAAGGQAQTNGDTDGPWSAARFNRPEDMALGKQGELFVADRYNHTIRRVAADGTVSTLAGKTGAFGLVDGKGSVARFREPLSLAVDAEGAAYVADFANHAIRKVGADGTTTTIAGNGQNISVDGPASVARFNYPVDVTLDSKGLVWVCEWSGGRLRKIDASGQVTTVLADGGVNAPLVGTGGLAVKIGQMRSALVTDTGVYFADAQLDVVRRWDPIRNEVTLVAGGGKAVQGFGGAVELKTAAALADAGGGSLVISVPGTHSLRRITPIGTSCDDGNDCTLDVCDPKTGCKHSDAGATLCDDGNPCQEATCDPAEGVCRSKPREDGVLCGDAGDCSKQCYHGQCSAVGVVITVAGSGSSGVKDGQGAQAWFASPRDIAGDNKGNFFVVDYYGASVRKVAPDGTVTTLAGGKGAGYAEGKGEAAKFSTPTGIAVDGAGNLYVSDAGNLRIRKVDPTGNVSTIVGNGKSGYADGDGLAAMIKNPLGIASTVDGVVAFSDAGNQVVRRYADGKVTTIAGTQGQCGAVDGPFGANKVCNPEGMDYDTKGVLWIADADTHSVRKLDTTGLLLTVIGDAAFAMRNNIDGVGRRAGSFYRPTDVVALADGTLLVTSSGSSAIRRVWPTQRVESVVGHLTTEGWLDGLGPQARLGNNLSLGRDAKGATWIADAQYQRVRKLRLDLTSCGDLLGGALGAAATSCQSFATTSKLGGLSQVWIDPDPKDALPAFPTGCDLTTAGGGWTRIDSKISGEQLAKLIGAKSQFLYKCKESDADGIVSPVYTGTWSWTKKVALAGTWTVNGQAVNCGNSVDFDKLTCGWGVGCFEGDAKTLLVPGQTAVDQCAAPGEMWTKGAMSICGKDNYASWVVYVRAVK